MTQYEQVIKVMEKNGGFATLGFLNNNVAVSNWKTKTPFASIRRIVQDKRFFFKIKPGLWALKKYKYEVLKQFDLEKKDFKKDTDFTHYYYQGLILEIGNIKGFSTYVSPQDKNQKYLTRKLSEVSSIDTIYEFSYPEIIRRAKTVDVVWFNERRLPNSFFEVEHTTDIQNSLLKFSDLQDFYSNFYIISDSARKREFEEKINYSVFLA
ncbi:MAG TPA: hypothetical protein VK021_09515 [Flavobacteriaceae bacterium]|nr:hypothetical protein [Flavobacteriaceae bacterium]